LLSALDTQPAAAGVKELIGNIDSQETLTWSAGSAQYDSLITEMLKCPAVDDPHYNEDFSCDYNAQINTTGRTAEIVKAICAAAVGSAAMLIQ
jgi:hypothetical protein